MSTKDQPVLPYARQWIDDDDVAAVVAALRGDWLTQGPTVQRFEEALAERCGAPYCVAVASGTAALHLACLGLGVRAGQGGVTSDVTFVASANGIRYAGGEVALADVDASTGLVGVDGLRAGVDVLRAKGSTPRVLIPVDFAGAVADLPAIAALGRELGAAVIEDAAHSLGATYEHEGQTFRAGACVHSDAAILSFHPVKHVTTIEGGAILVRDEGLYRALLELRSHGITRDPARMTRSDGPWYYEQHSLGFHYRLGDVQCALGLSQLAKLDRFLERRRAIAARYDAGIVSRGLDAHLAPLAVREGVRSAYHLYVIRLSPRAGEAASDVAERRRALFVALRERGIVPQVHYIPVHRQPDFAAMVPAGARFDGADAFYAGCLSLPMFAAMSERDVDRVLDAVAELVTR